MPSFCRVLSGRILLTVSVSALLWGSTARADHAEADAPEAAKPAATFATAKDWKLEAPNLSARGSSPFAFPLAPGSRAIFERANPSRGPLRVEVSVLDTTEAFDLPGIGRFECAVVQEDVFEGGAYVRQTHHWVAVDKATKGLFTFGNVSWEVDENGDKVFSSTWRAGEPDLEGTAEPGLVMPGVFRVGDRYQVEGHQNEAHRFGENVEKGVTVTTPAGSFKDCVRTRLRSVADPAQAKDTWWCERVGVVKDDLRGELIASSAVAGSDLSSFGKLRRGESDAAAAATAAAAAGPITEDQAKAIALKAVPGKVTDVAVETKGKYKVYTVEIVAKADGVETDVFVDMATGRIIATEK